jgi:chromosome segregation ATPase
MKSRFVAVVIAVSLTSLGGCVSSGTYQVKEQENQQLGRSLEETKSAYNELKEKYQAKEQESQQLGKSLEVAKSAATELQEKCTKLEESNNGQVEKLQKLSADFAALQLENVKLVEATKPENLLKALAEVVTTLQQRVDMLQAENTKMKQELLVPQKLQPVEAPPRKAPLDKELAPVAPLTETTDDAPAEEVEKTPPQQPKP